MSDAITIDGQSVPWLHSDRFDIGLIFGTLFVALLSAFIVVRNPALFPLVLFLDLWLLGYHHVIATFTRLCFDRTSVREHPFILFGLPVIVLAGVLLVTFLFGIWALTSIYLYWQWFHYTRQSWGISQGYRRKANAGKQESDRLLTWAFYLLPLWGILYRSWQAPDKFIGIDLVVIPTPYVLVALVGVMAVGSLVLWAAQRFRSLMNGEPLWIHTAYMVSHFIVFYVGYIMIEDITYGWLAINVWHNAQYILFVWLFNNKRYQSGFDAEAAVMSWLSQNGRMFAYMAVFFSISTGVYFLLEQAHSFILSVGIPSTIVLYQAINFHHYVTDSVIWKLRKPKMQKTLGLS